MNAEGRREIGNDHLATSTVAVGTSRRCPRMPEPRSRVSVRNKALAQQSPRIMYINFKEKGVTLCLRGTADKVTRANTSTGGRR